MATPQRARQELLQAAAILFERNLVTVGTGRHSLVKKAQQHRLLCGTDMAYSACIKTYHKGPHAMPRLWEDLLRMARAGGIVMSDFGQSRLTKVLANERPELAEVLAKLNAGSRLEGTARTALLRGAADTLVRKSEKLPATRSLAPRARSAPPVMSLDAAALGWISVFDGCLAPEPADPSTPIPQDRAAIALEALDRGAACDEAYRRAATASRARLGFPSTPRVDEACGAGTWVAARAVLAMAQQSADPLTVARAWAVEHDRWLRPRDEPGMAAQIARTLFDHGRTTDALRALELACLRNDPVRAPGLVDVGIDLCTTLLALGDREAAGRAIPPVIRALLDSPDFVHPAGSNFDQALAEALRQALVDPRLGLTALRRVWFASYRDESESSTAWLVAGALARCLRESGTPAEAGTVALLSRRLLAEPDHPQESRMRAALVDTEAVETEPPLEAERQRLHSLLDELEGLLLCSPQLAADRRIVRELAGITRVARRARGLVRPDRTTRV